MCSYLHRAPNGVYYFRMGIPADLRPFMGGKREIKRSLGLKDREAAKALIPDMTKAAHALLKQAGRDRDTAAKPVTKPLPPKSAAELNRERSRWEAEQEQAELVADANFAADMEIERLEPVMDAIAAGIEPDAPLSDIVRAGKLAIQHERETAGAEREALISSLHNRYGQTGRASGGQIQAIECEPPTGSGLYLDPDIVNQWKAEGSKRPKTIAMVKATASKFHTEVGKVPVDRITKAHLIDFKNKMLAEGQSVANVNIRLSHISLLLGWAARNDIVPSNVAIGTSLPNPQSRKSRRKPFKLPELKAIFSSPVFANGQRPTSGKGEAAYWIPIIALYTGARVREIAQLRCSDVREVEYADANGQMHKTWCLSITEDTDEAGLGTAIKTDASERLVPLHPELIELGFIEYVHSLTDRKGRAFPLLPEDIYGNPAAKWGEWFSGYLRKVCGVTDKRMTFHSFRHTFKDYARDARIDEGIQRQIMGHEGGDVADSYGSGYSLHVIVSAIASYRVPGLVIG